MSRRAGFIYLLADYANPEHLRHERHATEDEYFIHFAEKDCVIRLSETNSLVEERYAMTLHSAEYVAEGRTEAREAMIHHHPRGHPWRHLQFRLKGEHHRVLRIMLDPVDLGDYKRCIRGFISIAKTLVEQDPHAGAGGEDLVGYFFNEKVLELDAERRYLLERIARAYREGGFLEEDGAAVSPGALETLRKDARLVPFLAFGD